MSNYSGYKSVYSEDQEVRIKEEFSRLNDTVYLDHAGATLYSERQLDNVFRTLSKTIYGNPHAKSTTSKQTEDAIDVIRYTILEHFNTNSEEYTLIFTANATAALKLVAENFSYGNDHTRGHFVYLDDNHTSVLGMRAYADNINPITLAQAMEFFSDAPKLPNTKPQSKLPNTKPQPKLPNTKLQPQTNTKVQPKLSNNQQNSDTNSLFVYPAQSNFSGTKYPLSWIQKTKNGALAAVTKGASRWYVLLDAACFAGCNKLDLSLWRPDFVPISFYKMFGYPTGLGALLVRNESADVLTKKYYGGGTVFMAQSLENVVVQRSDLSERFEDGTLPFLSILSLKHGFDTISRFKLDFNLIAKHTFNLARYVYTNLRILHHNNGRPLCILYHDTTFETEDHQGGIVNFNLVRSNGDFIGFSEVLHMANLFKIQLRTGCFCNPGACQRHLQLTTEDIQKHFDAGHVCGDQHDLVDGYPTGSIRISFGYMSTKKDADEFLNMIQDCFLVKPIIRKERKDFGEIRGRYLRLFSQCSETLTELEDLADPCRNCLKNEIKSYDLKHEESIGPTKVVGTIDHIFLYPVKSCGAFQVTKSWELTDSGLKYDRQWMIINSSGTCVTQKHNHHLCLLRPIVDLDRERLVLTFPGQSDVSVPLNIDGISKILSMCESKICGDKVRAFDCGDDVAQWLSDCLSMPGLRLSQQIADNNDEKKRVSKDGERVQLSLANKAQYLLINSASIRWLRDKLPKDEPNEETFDSLVQRFRPNLVVDFRIPFLENTTRDIRIHDMKFKNTGNCTRCQMICINQLTGDKTKEPLSTLSRELKGKIAFGVYLSQELGHSINFVSLGDNVICENIDDV